MTIARLLEHRRLWSEKPVLERVYRGWFDALLRRLPEGCRVLEVGAGPGFFTSHARRARPDLRWIASDVAAAPWNDLAADAHYLPLGPATVDAVVEIDVVHHLERPRLFLEEVARVLRTPGVLLALEPWLTPLSYPVYRWMHQEGCRPSADPWNPFDGRGLKQPFDGDNGMFTKLVRSTSPQGWSGLGFHPPRVELVNGFAYLLSLGFRRASLLPLRLAPVALAVDRAAAPLARIAALRALVSWDRR